MRSFYVLALMAFGMDQLTKWQARAVLQENVLVDLVSGRMWATLAFNPHGAMSMGSGWSGEVLRPVLTLVSVLSLVLLWKLLQRREFQGPTARSGLALMAGGGLGNFWDHLVDARGVTDFLAIGHGMPQGGIFNFADVWVVFGATLGIAGMLGALVRRYMAERKERQRTVPGGARHSSQAAPRRAC